MAKRKTRRPGTASNPVTDTPDGPVQGEDDIATKAWKRWRDGSAHLKDWMADAEESYNYVAGRQWTPEEKDNLRAQFRPDVTFNRMDVVISSVSGYEINNRQDIAFLPREVDDTGAVQVESEAAKYYREQCDAEDEESDAFTDTLTCGLGWIEHRMDFDDDPDGMLKVERVDPFEMRYDPSSVKRNLVDRRWDIRGKWWEKSVAEDKFPDHDFDAAGNIAGDEFEALVGNSPVIREEAARYAGSGVGEQTDKRKDKVFILEMTWFESEPFVTYFDPVQQKEVDTEPKKFKELNEKAASLGVVHINPRTGQPAEGFKNVRRTRKAFKRAFIHGRNTLNLDDMEAPCPQGFHYQAITGKRDKPKGHWYGLGRLMKGPQEWANKWLSQTMHIMNANAKGGIMADEGAFERVDEVEQKLAKPGWVIQRRQGFAAEFVPPTPIPNTTFNLMTFAISSFRDVTGVNLELLGLADREQPGVLEHSRKQSAMATLAPFFDAMRRYRKQAGRLTLYFLGEYMADGRKVRIVSQGKAQWVPLTMDADFRKYDVIVDQSSTSPDMKRNLWGTLGPMMPMIAKMGVPIPPSLIKYVPDMPAELAQEWMAMLQPKENPMAEMMARLEALEKLAEIDKKGADTVLSEAKAAESVAKTAGTLHQTMAALGVVANAIPGGPDVAQTPMPEQPAAPPEPVEGAV